MEIFKLANILKIIYIIIGLISSLLIIIFFCENILDWFVTRFHTSSTTDIDSKFKIFSIFGLTIGGLAIIAQSIASTKRAIDLENQNILIKKNNDETHEREYTKILYSRFEEAIKLLDSESSSIRISAIYLLYHLAIDSKDFRKSICDIFCGYLRDKSNDSNYKRDNKLKPSIEIQTLLNLLCKHQNYFDKKNQNDIQDCIFNDQIKDLTSVFLVGANLENANLKNAILTQSNLRGCNLKAANLESAKLNAFRWRSLEDQKYRNMQDNKRLNIEDKYNQNLSKDILIQKYSMSVQLQGSDLSHANLYKADLSYAQLQGCNLSNVNFGSCNLFCTQIIASSFSLTAIKNAFINNTLIKYCYEDEFEIIKENYIENNKVDILTTEEKEAILQIVQDIDDSLFKYAPKDDVVCRINLADKKKLNFLH